jgi:hypothetical protein
MTTWPINIQNYKKINMKRFSINAFCLLLIGLLFQGCGADNIDPTSEKGLTMDGSSFDVTVVTLVGISLEESGHAALAFTGTNGALTKVLNVDFEYDPDQPVDGTYSFPAASGARLLNDWLTNYTEMPLSGAVYSTVLEKGTVTVKDNGDADYTIKIDLEMKDGKIFKGTYQGTVKAVFQ